VRTDLCEKSREPRQAPPFVQRNKGRVRLASFELKRRDLGGGLV
jgi:hypothetical protein